MTTKRGVNIRIAVLLSASLIAFAICGTSNIIGPSQILRAAISPLSPPMHASSLIRGLKLPPSISAQQIEIASQKSGSVLPWNRTSDYMLGTVSVAVILPQCLGNSCTESWTIDEISQVRSEVDNALQWWQQKAIAAGVNVQFQIVPGHPITVATSIEPINVPGGNSTALCGNEGAWIDQVMANLGFNYYPPTGDQYLNDVKDYDNYLRQIYHTNWAFAVLVADASSDAINDPIDGPTGRGLFRFTTCGGTTGPFGVSGYGWITGPHMVMNNVNNGFGSILMDGVAAMEIGHIFGAPDELYAPGACMPPTPGPSCNAPWGYLGQPNGNCRYDSDPNIQTCMLNDNLSLMRYPEDYGTGVIQNTVNFYTRGHIGWNDFDGDGLADPIDTTPALTLNAYSPDPTSTRTPMYIGSAQDVPMHTTQPGYADITINNVTIEYRVNGGSWHPADATDGAFDSPHEDFRFVPLLCQNTTYLIEARAINSVGHVSTVTGDTLTVSSAIPCRSVFLPVIMMSYGTGTLQSRTRPPTEPNPFRSPLPPPKLFHSPLRTPEK